MKKTIIALSVTTIITFLLACNDAAIIEKPTDTAQDILAGEWVWIKTSGGFAGIVETPNDNKLVRILNFSDKNVSVSENSKLLGSATYSFTNKKSILKGQNTDFILLNTANCSNCKLAPEYDYDLKGKDTLLLEEDANDGFLHVYLRKSEGYKAATYLGIDPKLCPSPCCGGYLFNIDGITYQASQLPAGVVIDAQKVPQKFTIKYEIDKNYTCTPQPIKLTEMK